MGEFSISRYLFLVIFFPLHCVPSSIEISIRQMNVNQSNIQVLICSVWRIRLCHARATSYYPYSSIPHWQGRLSGTSLPSFWVLHRLARLWSWKFVHLNIDFVFSNPCRISWDIHSSANHDKLKNSYRRATPPSPRTSHHIISISWKFL